MALKIRQGRPFILYFNDISDPFRQEFAVGRRACGASD